MVSFSFRRRKNKEIAREGFTCYALNAKQVEISYRLFWFLEKVVRIRKKKKQREVDFILIGKLRVSQFSLHDNMYANRIFFTFIRKKRVIVRIQLLNQF